MSNSSVNIDFIALGKALQLYIREKAKISGSTIVYKSGDQLIEENLRTFKKTVLKKYIPS
jgi:hypothetical protein